MLNSEASKSALLACKQFSRPFDLVTFPLLILVVRRSVRVSNSPVRNDLPRVALRHALVWSHDHARPSTPLAWTRTHRWFV